MKCENSGFTLIEILIAIAILSLIGVFTGSAVYSTYQAKTATLRDLETIDIGRTVMRLITRDINLAFHKARYEDNSKSKNTSYYKEDENRESIKTVFVGKNNDPYDELHFTSLSKKRIYKNSKESKQTEVSYFVEPDIENSETMILFKRETVLIDEDPLEGGIKYKLAEGVMRFELKYWDCKREDYFDEWNSVDSPDTVNRFPEAVKIVLGLDDLDGGEKIFETVVLIQMPNNIERRSHLTTIDKKSVGTLKKHCGNKICEADKGENSVNCPSDCKKTAKKKDAKKEEKKPLLKIIPEGTCSQ